MIESKIGFYANADNIPSTSPPKKNNIYFALLGDGIYLFESLNGARAYLNAVKSPIKIRKYELKCDKDLSIDLDAPQQMDKLIDAINGINEDMKSSGLHVFTHNYIEILSFLIQVYKDTANIDVISFTPTEKNPFYRLVKGDIRHNIRLAVFNKKIYCVSDDCNLHMLLNI